MNEFKLEQALNNIKEIVNFRLKSSKKLFTLTFDPNFSNQLKNEVFVELV